MRRKDREITDMETMLDILRRCDTVRIGMRGEEFPYVVPVSLLRVFAATGTSVHALT